MTMQTPIQAVFMRGGTSKGVFFREDWLPGDLAIREQVLLRVIGSPDPYGQQIDGMGGGTSSTTKVVILGPAQRADCDVNYTFGAVSIRDPVIDWSGNCGNLTSAVGPFAIAQGLVAAPENGIATVRIWQTNIRARIIARVPMRNGKVVEGGDFILDGVAFPAAEIPLEFLQDADQSAAMFPTGHLIETVDIPGVGPIEATLISAGNPTIIVKAATLGLTGAELQSDINGDATLLARAEAIRAHCAVLMGVAATPDEATQLRPHTPKLAFVSRPLSYVAANGRAVAADDIQLNARIFSMGKLHHAMTGTGAVALAAAAAIPGTMVSETLGAARTDLRFGHPSGTLSVGAQTVMQGGHWAVTSITMSRSARRLMEGVVLVPDAILRGGEG
ncbi:2-methylaconitate cis-trans isomerase PrpF [Falsiroseomonas sp.]|uniref:2-methylaconitate cis-trans isomerase PrpF n=1 Tax=Falsiroseomonas sp. TaxID=2870721 RepID=UPI0034A1F975